MLAVLNMRYTFLRQIKSRDFNENHAQWMDKNTNNYPRSAWWHNDDILLATVSEFCSELLIIGCVLYGAGAISEHQRNQLQQKHNHHIRTRKLLRHISNQLPKPPAPKLKTSASNDNTSEKQSSSPPTSENTRPQLSPWWPASPTGISIFCTALVAAFFASTAVTGEPISGIVSAGLWYLIVICVRYFAVVAPSRK